ncbi:hypothetical protein B0T24DRAFT_636259 [Lasiosphaeria ovina]|uniref:Secreted protein n=1 Tax=Lasiosphaeria ovina TaxID=92902 RepID=A0AAE0JX11_9PEZI|nr:hypothetical protein B0T24DRAFT_636259 [Lasiosphaeria ovina]
MFCKSAAFLGLSIVASARAMFFEGSDEHYRRELPMRWVPGKSYHQQDVCVSRFRGFASLRSADSEEPRDWCPPQSRLPSHLEIN